MRTPDTYVASGTAQQYRCLRAITHTKLCSITV
jgi:hypothetical protein